MITSKLSLLDANVLVYANDETSPCHQASVTLIEKGFSGEVALCVTPQVLHEYFAVVTDGRRVTKPRTQAEAVAEMEKYVQSRNMLKIYHTSDFFGRMIDLLKCYSVSRQEIFDLQLVAVALANGVDQLYTYDDGDFSRYREIEVLSPESVLQ
jgi:predicted nucleic acid-binding protein